MLSQSIYQDRTIRTINLPKNDQGRVARVPEFFGKNVFSLATMKQRLDSADVHAMERVMSGKEAVSVELAGRLAVAIKDWAAEQGVSHYCHWFQPQTGSTAEKHDAFIDYGDNGEIIEKFGAWSLIQGEPDASSFPSGGIRSTFEARGYTGWDPRSPIFILENENGKTLYIPCVFLGYHGEALDFKTPLLRSEDALRLQIKRLLKHLGERSEELLIKTTVGPEQEFFVVDKHIAQLRPDLRISGRTLIGRCSAKTQELEDHYFASIPSRVQAMLNELELELYKVGVPIKTRHNEVAPCQFEVAPIFEDANIAIDHNQLLMNLLQIVGDRHGFVVLLNEKPFAGMNGSGKHVNWSVSDNLGRNYLDPGSTPHSNLLFLTFLSAVVKGVSMHETMLRASIASYGNDYRLGANEAPPAIMSVFLGQTLSAIFKGIEEGSPVSSSAEKVLLDLGVTGLQSLRKDNTDRNRTSPFAFTGNKFEFRAVGSSAPIGYPVAVLNTVVASGLKQLNDRLDQAAKGGSVSQEQILGVLTTLARESKAVRFEGDGYSEEWVVEAQKRGLSNYRTTPDSLAAVCNPEIFGFLVEHGVLSENDIRSRLAIQVERYVKHQLIDLRVAIEMVETGVLPAALTYLGTVARTAQDAQALGLSSVSKEQAQKISDLVNGLSRNLEAVKTAVEKVSSGEAVEEHNLFATAKTIANDVLVKYQKLRASADALEGVLPAELYPFPSYDEMLFGSL
jgi:glutamine synthetase